MRAAGSDARMRLGHGLGECLRCRRHAGDPSHGLSGAGPDRRAAYRMVHRQVLDRRRRGRRRRAPRDRGRPRRRQWSTPARSSRRAGGATLANSTRCRLTGSPPPRPAGGGEGRQAPVVAVRVASARAGSPTSTTGWRGFGQPDRAPGRGRRLISAVFPALSAQSGLHSQHRRDGMVVALIQALGISPSLPVRGGDQNERDRT
jgi:hypothetical protein